VREKGHVMQGLDSVDETSADIDSGPIPVDGPPGTPHPAEAPDAPDRETLKEQVLEVLKEVHDPELGVNIVDLGLVYGVEIDGGTVHITYTLTTMGCPIGPLIEAEMKQFLSGVDGISEVNAEMVLRPAWTPEMMSDEAKAALGFF
jgi:metal-sulfur cluster biosynthetic enzyme